MPCVFDEMRIWRGCVLSSEFGCHSRGWTCCADTKRGPSSEVAGRPACWWNPVVQTQPASAQEELMRPRMKWFELSPRIYCCFLRSLLINTAGNKTRANAMVSVVLRGEHAQPRSVVESGGGRTERLGYMKLLSQTTRNDEFFCFSFIERKNSSLLPLPRGVSARPVRLSAGLRKNYWPIFMKLGGRA